MKTMIRVNKYFSISIVLIMLFTWPNCVFAGVPALNMINSEVVTSGAVLKKYSWVTMRNNNQQSILANVIEVDLLNPNVKIDSMAGTDQQFTKKQNIVEMTNNTKAVAGINGDFYNTKAEGVPEGAQIMNGNMIASPPKISGLYSFIINQDNKPIIDIFNFKGKVTTEDGQSYELGGINKTYYWGDSGTHSHIDSIFMYTSAWGSVDRSNDGVTYPTEILVRNNIIEYIGTDEVIQSIPPQDGYILRATGKGTEFVRNHMKIGQHIALDYQIYPLDQSITDSPQTFKMMIGGNTLLVDEGKSTVYTRNIKSIDGYGYRSRTAVGYSKDKNTVYLITVDKNGSSPGMNIAELQQFMIDIGVWRGMVLDGGGSTQMASRPLGEFETILANKTEFGTERKVVNGIGVYSIAPQAPLNTLLINGVNEVYVNEPYIYQVKGYDQYFNPSVIDNETVKWSSDEVYGKFENQTFIMKNPGISKIKAQIGLITTEKEVRSIGRNAISDFMINTKDSALSAGGKYQFSAMIITKSGNKIDVPQHLMQWEAKGVKGEFNQGNLTVQSIDDPTKVQIIANFDGYSTMLTLPIGITQPWYDLDVYSHETFSAKSPYEVIASVEMKSEEDSNQSLALNYDFSVATGTKVAKAYFLNENGISIQSTPQYLNVNVFGDRSLNTIVAEFQDANSKIFKIQLAEQLDWNGWKSIRTNLFKYNMQYPIAFKSLSVVSDEQNQLQRASKGQIRFDDISFTYKNEIKSNPKNRIILAVNKKDFSVNNTNVKLENTPLMTNGKTMIPMEVVTKAFGGTIKWDGSAKKLTILHEKKLLEYWINNQDFNVNGKKITSEVAPVIINGKSYVPLRTVSQNLGWELTWDAKNQQIVLK